MSENKKIIIDNGVLKKFILSNNQKLVKIMASPKSTNSQSSPILIPSCNILESQSGNSIIKQHKNELNSKTSVKSVLINTPKSQMKNIHMKVSSVIDKTMDNRSPETDSISTNILKSNVLNTSSESNSQPVFIPQKKNKIEYVSDSDNASPVECSSNDMLDFNNLESDKSANPVHSNNKKYRTVNNAKIQKTSKLSIAQIKHMEDKRFKKMNILLLKQLKLNNALREKISLMSSTIRRLIKHHSKDYKRFLYDVFNQDQLRFLELKHTNPRSIVTWSDETMKKAVKLKGECGNRGYEELLNQNMPLPSIRTISRWCNLRDLPIP